MGGIVNSFGDSTPHIFIAAAIACVQDGRPALVEVITSRGPTSLHRLRER
jgi:hypothetical protein